MKQLILFASLSASFVFGQANSGPAPAPPKDRTFVAAVGGDESQEFIRQSLAITSLWHRAGVKAECVIVPGTNHFTVVEELANPESAMVARLASLARMCAEPRKGA